MKLHKLFSLSALSLLALPLFALPGVNSYIPDQSGEYVYYQDTTFARPTYAGFLFYNDSQYALRYYAAADAKTKQDEVDIELLISINPENEKLDFTGELVVKDGESTLINYMHDLFYDLTAKRKKAGDIKGDEVTSNDFYEMFGGAVVMKYSSLVPIFNVKSIQNERGEEQLKLVCVGRLKSSQDTSFEDFKGFSKKIADKKRKTCKNGKMSLLMQVANEANGEIVALADDSWKQSLPNIWIQGNDAVLTLVPLQEPEIDGELFENFMLRNCLQSGEHSYIDYANALVSRSGGVFTVKSRYVSGESVQQDIKVLKPMGSGFAMLHLTVFDSIYQKKKAYYDAIVKSFSVK